MTSVWVSRSANKRPDALEVLRRAHVADQIGLPAYDQLLAGLADAGPGGEPRVDEPGRDRVEFAARGLARALDFRRASASVRPRTCAFR